MKRTIHSLALLLIIPTSLFAQQPDCRHRTIPVSVVDEKEVPIAGLTAENFRGSFRGAPVRIVSVKLDTSPRRIVILLDLSGTMGTQNQHVVGQVLVWRLLRSSQVGSEFALLTFADEVKLKSGFLQDRQSINSLADEIGRLDAKAYRGRTVLWDAVGDAVKLLTPVQQGDVIYVFTDGLDSASKKHKSDVERILLDRGIRFFATLVLTTPGFRMRTAREARKVEELADLAEQSGGSMLELPFRSFGARGQYDVSSEGQKKIFQAADGIFKQMQQSYLLEVDLAKEVDRPRSWKLKAVSDSVQFKGFHLHYPRTLTPCSAAKDIPQATPK